MESLAVQMAATGEAAAELEAVARKYPHVAEMLVRLVTTVAVLEHAIVELDPKTYAAAIQAVQATIAG